MPRGARLAVVQAITIRLMICIVTEIIWTNRIKKTIDAIGVTTL